MRNLILVGLALALAGGAAPAAEPAAEQVLPLEKGRDAYTPAAAFGKDSFLVVWQSGLLAPGKLREGPKYNGDIVGCRVDKSGKALDAEAFPICAAPDAQELPQVAFGDGQFLVVWQDIRNGKDWDVYAARVSADGKVLDKDGFLVCGGAHNQAKPRVAWDGKAFFLVWQDYRSGNQYATYGARVSAQGQVLDAGGVQLDPCSYSPEVASLGGGRSLVVVVTLKSCEGPKPQELPFGVIMADGKIEKPLTITYVRGQGPTTPAPSSGQCPVAMAAGKDSFLMAWKTFTPFGRGWSGAQRFPAMGNQAFDGLILGTDASRKDGLKLMGHFKDLRLVDPDVAWDGAAYVAAWHETLSGKGGYDYDTVYAALVAPDGKELGPVMNLAGKLDAPAREVCVASNGAGVTLIGYEKCPEKPDVPVTIAVRMLAAR